MNSDPASRTTSKGPAHVEYLHCWPTPRLPVVRHKACYAACGITTSLGVSEGSGDTDGGPTRRRRAAVTPNRPVYGLDDSPGITAPSEVVSCQRRHSRAPPNLIVSPLAR